MTRQKAFQGTPYTEMPEESRKPRACAICQTQFIPHSGVHKYCSVKCKEKGNQSLGSMSVERQYERISGDWRRYFNRLRLRSQKREKVSTNNLLTLLEKQEGKCALSGVPLTCLLEQGKKFKTNASLDRINAGEEYTIDNIQLVCSALNSWRGDTELEEFIWFCKQVTQHQERKEGEFVCRT